MDDYSETSGYVADVDLGLGCVQPTQFAQVKKGDTLIDLGSGAGNDCFVARHETGSEGKVIRIDFTPIMIEKALGNAEKRETNDDKPKVTLTEFIFQIFVGQRADVVDFTKIIDGTILSWEDA